MLEIIPSKNYAVHHYWQRHNSQCMRQSNDIIISTMYTSTVPFHFSSWKIVYWRSKCTVPHRAQNIVGIRCEVVDPIQSMRHRAARVQSDDSAVEFLYSFFLFHTFVYLFTVAAPIKALLVITSCGSRFTHKYQLLNFSQFSNFFSSLSHRPMILGPVEFKQCLRCKTKRFIALINRQSK